MVPLLRKLLLCTALLLALPAAAQVSRGRIVEGLTVKSDILGRDVRYCVYLPYDYDTSARAYPVVYLLHGLGDNETGWVQFGEIQLAADKAIANQEIAPMIIVMPDAARTWYINNYDGSVRYEDFFFDEFMPTVESTWRIRGEERYRGIAGLSMGGYGSLLYSMRHPKTFAACAAFSSGIHTDDEVLAMNVGHWNHVYSPVFGPDLEGEARLSPHRNQHDILTLAETLDVGQLKNTRYYLDCGDDDFLAAGNAMLHLILKRREVPHEARMREGGHQWSYWRSGITDGLAFISTSFHQN